MPISHIVSSMNRGSRSLSTDPGPVFQLTFALLFSLVPYAPRVTVRCLRMREAEVRW